jgi:hypothetical protein
MINIEQKIFFSSPFLLIDATCYRLLVHVNRVEHLPPKGEHNTYSVVVKLMIFPLDKPVRVSKIYKNDLNPEIEEDFEFTLKHLLGKVLRLSLHDADHQGKYDAIGHALFYLEDMMAGRPRRYAMRLYKQSQVCNCLLGDHLKNIHSRMFANHIFPSSTR